MSKSKPVQTTAAAKPPAPELTPNQQKVVAILTECLIVDESEVTPGSSLMEDLGASSLDVIEIVMELEEKFDIIIGDADAEKFAHVQNIYDYLAKHVTLWER